jgi:hypothetical protein
MKNDETFMTNDLYFAAYLQVAGAPMQKAAKQTSGRISFLFDSSVVNIEELKTAWYNNTGKVPALPYANAVKSLKHLCHIT